MHFSLRLPLLASAALLSVSSFAQTTAPSATPMTPSPAGVGTSAQTAAEANQKAIQRPDTGTVVRTSPSAADKARQTVAPATGSTKTGSGSTSTVMAADASSSAPPSGRMRAARADRN